jgi:hypothetical protein
MPGITTAIAASTWAGRGPRVFDVGAGRCIHLIGERAFFVVAPGYDRDLISFDAPRMERACCDRCCSGVGKERQDQGMSHRRYVTS